MSTKVFVVTAALLLAFPVGAFAQDEGDKAYTPGTLLNKLHGEYQQQLELAKLVTEKSKNQEVVEFASTMLREHEQGAAKIKQVAEAKGIALMPSKPTSEAGIQREKENAAWVAKLKTMSGNDFDREYMTMVATRHDKTVALLKAAKTEVKDPQVVTLIGELQPTEQKHADRAEVIAVKCGAKPEDFDRERT